MRIQYEKDLTGKNLSSEDIVSTLLANRNIANSKEFFLPKHPESMHISDFGPYTAEIKATQKLLKSIYDTGKTVVVYTDYDADGITGGSILWETLHLLGFRVMPYVPQREREGYGFSNYGIDAVRAKYDPGLIISVDHGITARKQIAYAKSLGIPVIVTDHHLKPEHDPEDAAAIFHIPALSGSGVSYFFSKLLYETFGTNRNAAQKKLEHFFTSDYAALAAVGTIADLVPLVGPSRSVAKHGLAAFQDISRIGLLELLDEAGIAGKPITPYEVGFQIAPRINAVGRLKHALDGLRLLCTTDPQRARALATEIGQLNRKRQDMVSRAQDEASQQIETSKTTAPIKILTSDSWHEGIIGLIAGKITQSYHTPSIVMTKSGDIYKGSARSIPALHMTTFLRELSNYLIDVGGHSQAAGFSIEASRIDEFVRAAEEKAALLLKPEDLEPVITADIKTSLSTVRKETISEMERMEPFGIGNPQPKFYSRARLIDARKMGKTGSHLRLSVTDETSTEPLELVSFGTGDRFETLAKDMMIDTIYSPSINRWGGRETIQGKTSYFSAA